ncbi:MAG TPA: EamA/RhaT family transporter [Oleiagrimonas sp.]|nr:EamA/RhaT family transporter [Oleiagrimonas sp.]
MTYIILSVLCSVAVSALLKLAPRLGVDVRQAIAGNYLVAAALAMGLFHPDPGLLMLPVAYPAWHVLIGLGVLLPLIFLVMARSVERVGVVRTDAAQRLSLLVSLIAAFTLFGETLTWQKGVGMVVGLVAIACIVARRESTSGTSAKTGWWWPIGVFAGFGAIDILFKRMAQLARVPFTDVLFATFVLAFVLASAGVAWLYLRERARWRWRHVSAAVLLGALNFGNILFYVQAHRHLAHDPSLVFSSMNIGVIVVATLVGMWCFAERPSRLNRVGLVLAVAAVLVLASA